MKPAARGWKGQAILVNRHLTNNESPARAQGLMPGFAAQALRIAIAGAKLAGMAKKRWRDADAGKMSIKDVQKLRLEMNSAFDALEAVLDPDANPNSAVKKASAAEKAYAHHGLMGLNALAIIEEAGELAKPLNAVAIGATSITDAVRSIEDEAADIRTWLHLIDTSVGINPVSTTQDKWDRSVVALGKRAQEALTPPAPLAPEEAAASMAALKANSKGR